MPWAPPFEGPGWEEDGTPKGYFNSNPGGTLDRIKILFTGDGRLEIDNNTVERTLRLCAIGRKNWMLLGSDQGGETAAICFSDPGRGQAAPDRAVGVCASFTDSPVVGPGGP